MKTLITLLMISLAFWAVAQKASDINLTIHPGFFYRSTALEMIGSDPNIPFNYEKNLQGKGLSFGVELGKLFGKISLDYGIGLRYDHIGYEGIINQENEINDWILDHTITIKYYHGIFSKRSYLGLEKNFLNNGHSLLYRQNNDLKELNLYFETFSVSLGIPIKFIFIEPKISFAHRNSPYTSYSKQRFEFLEISIIYPVSLFKKD